MIFERFPYLLDVTCHGRHSLEGDDKRDDVEGRGSHHDQPCAYVIIGCVVGVVGINVEGRDQHVPHENQHQNAHRAFLGHPDL